MGAFRNRCGRTRAVTVFGSAAKGSDTVPRDINPLLVGDELSYSGLYSALQNAESLLQRKVNPLFITVKDWRREASQKHSFANKVKAQPKLFVFGAEMDIEV